RYLSDELTIHYGLLPRTHRGIFAINELPDLAERIQVGLLNIMEERDVQIRGYKVRLPLDLYVVASANPEDYTNRGRIITPLKDRFGSQIRTHYPRRIEDEIEIMEAERTAFADDGFAEKALNRLVQKAVVNVFNRSFSSSELEEVVGAFQRGLKTDVAESMPSREYVRQIGEVRALQGAVGRLEAARPAQVAAAV